jgi:hypothetical protein
MNIYAIARRKRKSDCRDFDALMQINKFRNALK